MIPLLIALAILVGMIFFIVILELVLNILGIKNTPITFLNKLIKKVFKGGE